MVSAHPKGRPTQEPKRERMELRVASSAKAMIQRAMAVSGMTAGDLAYEGARHILDAHQRMELAGADADAFLKAVASPPAPTDRLIKALDRHKAMVG